MNGTESSCCRGGSEWDWIKGPCKRTQQVGTTLSNFVGIVLADVGFRVFKRSQHVGRFYDNTLESLSLIFNQNSLRNYNVVTFVRHDGAR